MDTLGRRHREVPSSSGKRITPQPADVLVCELLHRLGPLSRQTLITLTSHLRKNAFESTKRLGDLYHEANTPHGGPYLSRPEQQFYTLNAERNQLAYDLTKHGKQLLKDHGKFRERAPGAAAWGHWFHDHFLATALASIYADAGDAYVFQDTILERCNTDLSFMVDGKKLVPDGLFGINYGHKKILYMVEAYYHRKDTGTATETIRSRNDKKKTFQRSLDQYGKFITSKEPMKIFGTPVMVLNLFTNLSSMQTAMSITDKSFMLFRYVPEAAGMSKPYDLFKGLYGSYVRVGHPMFSMSKGN